MYATRALDRSNILLVATIAASLLASVSTSFAATILDDFSAGPFHLIVTEPSDSDGDDDFELDPGAVIGGRRRAFVRHEAGLGTITADVVATAGGAMIYAATGSAVGEQLGLAYGSNIGGSLAPMSVDIASQGASALAIDVEFSSHDVPLELFYVSHALEGPGGVSGSSFMQTTLLASPTRYTAVYPFSALQLNSGAGTDFADLDGITITFGRGLEPIPAGAQFRINAMRFVPEPTSAVLIGAAALTLGLRPRRRRVAGMVSIVHSKYQSGSRRVRCAALGWTAALGVVGAAASVHAQFLTYRFTGVVQDSFSSAVDVGDPIDGTFTYALHEPDELADPNTGKYSYWGLFDGPAPIGMSFTAGSYVGSSSGNSRWEVSDDLPHLNSLLYPQCDGQCDAFRFSNTWGLTQANDLTLVDRSGTAFDSDDSPAVLNLDDFSVAELDAWAEGRTFLARIRTLELIDSQPIPPPRGDFNQNGAVDAADYVVWRKTLGQTGEGLAADHIGQFSALPDGVVDERDYNFWRARFGYSSPSIVSSAVAPADPLSAAVPEPSTIAVLSTLPLALSFRNRRRSVKPLLARSTRRGEWRPAFVGAGPHRRRTGL